MKTTTGNSTPTTTAVDSNSDSAKLVSLLALATGAVAMPQAVNADIIVTDLGANPGQVGFSPGFNSSFTFNNLPGDANGQFGFRATLRSVYTPTYSVFTVVYRTVTVGRQAGSLGIGVQSVSSFVSPQSNGAPWNSSLGLWYSAYVGRATTYSHVPLSGYDHLYLGWVFQDTTQAGSPLLTGWVEISLAIANNIGPDVTIWRYAYDTTPGDRITMGAVPEPSSVSLLAFGAMAFGARGVRAWRRNRPGNPKS